MGSASFVDSVSQAKGITFYSSAASVGQHFMCNLERTKGFELCGLDIAVRVSEAWTPC